MSPNGSAPPPSLQHKSSGSESTKLRRLKIIIDIPQIPYDWLKLLFRFFQIEIKRIQLSKTDTMFDLSIFRAFCPG